MLTLYHAPFTRSTRILALLHELDIRDRVQIRLTHVPRLDGTGKADPANPHPDHKVPALLDGDCLVTESNAIILHLTDLFPGAGMGVPAGDPQRGDYLSWLAWYGNVLEPVFAIRAAEVSHPILRTTFRGPEEVISRIATRLADGRPFLMGDRYTAVDLLVQSPFGFFPDALPAIPALQEWSARCAARPGMEWAMAQDARATQDAAG